MAEMLLQHLGKGHYRTFSAGSVPTGKVHPQSIETLNRHGVDPREPRSKSWDEFSDTHFDLIVTAHGQATGTEKEITSAFDQAFHLLKTRIEKELLP